MEIRMWFFDFDLWTPQAIIMHFVKSVCLKCQWAWVFLLFFSVSCSQQEDHDTRSAGIGSQSLSSKISDKESTLPKKSEPAQLQEDKPSSSERHISNPVSSSPSVLSLDESLSSFRRRQQEAVSRLLDELKGNFGNQNAVPQVSENGSKKVVGDVAKQNQPSSLENGVEKMAKKASPNQKNEVVHPETGVAAAKQTKNPPQGLSAALHSNRQIASVGRGNSISPDQKKEVTRPEKTSMAVKQTKEPVQTRTVVAPSAGNQITAAGRENDVSRDQKNGVIYPSAVNPNPSGTVTQKESSPVPVQLSKAKKQGVLENPARVSSGSMLLSALFPGNVNGGSLNNGYVLPLNGHLFYPVTQQESVLAYLIDYCKEQAEQRGESRHYKQDKLIDFFPKLQNLYIPKLSRPCVHSELLAFNERICQTQQDLTQQQGQQESQQLTLLKTNFRDWFENIAEAVKVRSGQLHGEVWLGSVLVIIGAMEMEFKDLNQMFQQLKQQMRDCATTRTSIALKRKE